MEALRAVAGVVDELDEGIFISMGIFVIPADQPAQIPDFTVNAAFEEGRFDEADGAQNVRGIQRAAISVNRLVLIIFAVRHDRGELGRIGNIEFAAQ